MKIEGAVKLYTEVTVRHYRDGQLLSEEVVHNTTTQTGYSDMSSLFIGKYKWLALDSSSTAYTNASTALVSEITGSGLDRASATTSQVTTTYTNDTAQLVHTWTASAAQTVQGVGIFDTSTASAGDMPGAAHFTAKNMEANDTLQITYKVKVS